MQLLLWPSGEPTIKARTAIVPSHHCAWLVKALLPLRGPKRFDIKAWPWTKNPQPNIRPDALSAPQDSPASPSRSSDQVNAIMQVDFEPGVWGYLEPLVPSPGVERITFREPCLMQGVNFGRSPSNDFVLKGAGVSHLHATIQWNGTRDTMSVVTLTDWRSKNGTFVDNIKVQGTHQLFDGSLVSFASKVPVVQEATDFRYIFRHPYGRSKSETVFSHYIVSNKLGGGAYGTVFRAMERKSGKVFAMKTACKSIKRTDTITCAGQETMALMLLNHTNVCKLHEVFFRIDGNIVDIILEFVDGLNLHDYIEGTRPSPLNEAQMKELAFQICTGLAYVHGAGVSHGDLKPDNILVSRGDFPVVKLVDFGLARVIGCYNAKPMITTHSYTAPEAPKQNEDLGESIQIAHSMVWDNWALGCIFYYLLSYTQLKPGFIIWDVLNGRSDQAVDLVRNGLLLEDPRHRTTAVGALNHPWLSGYLPNHVSFASVPFEGPDPSLFETPPRPEDGDADMESDSEAEVILSPGRKGKGRRRLPVNDVPLTARRGPMLRDRALEEAEASRRVRRRHMPGPARLQGRPMRSGNSKR